MIVLDTSVVIALMNRRDNAHSAAVSWVSEIKEELITTPPALAEIDHLLLRFGGRATTRAFHNDLSRGAYLVEWSTNALQDTLGVLERFSNFELGLVDASLVALAAKIGTNQIATLDERHFRVITPLTGEPAFRLLPADLD